MDYGYPPPLYVVSLTWVTFGSQHDLYLMDKNYYVYPLPLCVVSWVGHFLDKGSQLDHYLMDKNYYGYPLHCVSYLGRSPSFLTKEAGMTAI